jgi:glycosyltransferase involved in cell wall biosynthesis
MLEVTLSIINFILAGIAILMARQLHKAFKSAKAPLYSSKLANETDLPSVTVCIPARNEAHALAYCLEKVIASDYEKLEIIVLDDVSGDDTSALIKSFAHEGVRFIKGTALPKGWLGKNHALQGLLQEASGSYILFIDVDTRLEPKAVEHMVRYALSKRASMVSVLPRREDGWRLSVIASPLRYFWELIFNRRLWPATASSAWLIRREVLLKRFDGFKAFKTAVQPEEKIAAELASTHEYRFLISTEVFGVSYEKKWRSQLITSTRLLYPLLGNQLALSFIALLDLLLLLVPFVALVVLLPLGLISPLVAIFSAVIALTFCVLYGIYAHKVWRHGWLVGAILWPLLVLQEAVLVVVSAVQYQRRAVTWKGRLIRQEVEN